ncbi:hypothetical protein Glove_168g186 [Diversispora epigaea]|uniref:Uncharacterized protein n=1 Tax=Diversispora epigaea TaxID=1348612 RepID=A0A397IT92_9GLOM|nr:hypothetical protein Glove_168g186 [Diversispora epigaea]
MAIAIIASIFIKSVLTAEFGIATATFVSETGDDLNAKFTWKDSGDKNLLTIVFEDTINTFVVNNCTFAVLDKDYYEVIDLTEYIRKKLTTNSDTGISYYSDSFDISVMSVDKVVNQFIAIYHINSGEFIGRKQIIGQVI